jgi:NAD(P)-dependent dehydrogenase (short-subunit alcohol dehydrogenase family)
VQYLARDTANTIIGIVRDKTAADKAVAADGLKNVTMIQAEIGNKKALLAARAEIEKITGGSVDYLINNAALIDRTSQNKALDEFEDESEILEDALVDSFKVNTVGVIHTINAFLPLIKKGSAKKVVLISSGMADPALVNGGIATDAPYTISKAAANMAIYKYNAKYKKDGILFFALSPGVVSTWDGPEPAVIENLRQMAPHWEGPITPLQSAEACLKVTYSFNAEENGGSFVSHHGTQQWL